MPAISTLSNGVMARIMAGEDVHNPVLQVLGVKKISGGETERLRLLLSDGKYVNSFAMLATQLNELHLNGKLEENTIIQADKYITSVVNKTDNGKRVLIILELTILNPGSQVGRKIGEPVNYSEATREAAAAPKPNYKSEASKPSLYNNNNNTNNNNVSSSAMNQTLNAGLTHPIASLSPYQNKWVIKARVITKSAIRTWNNAKGEGKLFSMDLMDESGEIRATAFKDQVDKYYDMIQPDRVYFFSKCQLKPANKQFSTLKNDYEMTFTNDTLVQECEEEDTGIPDVKYDFIEISKIGGLEPKTAVDTIGICKEVGELQTFTSRTTNKEFKKRDLTLIDTSNAAVSLTLWGDEAVNFEGHVQPVILVKGARVNEFNGGKSLSMSSGSVMKINPELPEGHKLRGWFDNGGGDSITTMVSARTGGGNFNNTEWLTFHEAAAKNLGAGDKADYFQLKGVVHSAKSANSTYKACPQPDCNKKVVDQDNDHYRCERCNQTFTNFKYKILLNMNVGDWTSNRWVTGFSDTGEQILKHTAQEVGEAMANDEPRGEAIFAAVSFQTYIFKFRAKMEIYGDVNRIKFTVQSATPINYREYNKHLISNLTALTGINKI